MRYGTATLITLVAWVALAEPVDTLIDNGDPSRRIDMVVMGDGYTAAEMADFRSEAESIVDGIFRDEPFRNYKRFFNVHIVTVESPESGVDHPEKDTPVYRETALGAYYNCGGTPRLTCVDSGLVEAVLNRSLEVAERDFVLIMLNDETWGGSGGRYAVQGGKGNRINLTLHELGHLFGLCDEYAYDFETAWCRTTEPWCPNATAATDRTEIKWNAWINDQTPVPTSTPASWSTVGLYEGAKYCPADLYRPTYVSKMRNSRRPWDAVNVEGLIKGIYTGVSLIDAVSPPAGRLTLENYGHRVFSAEVLRPEPDTTEVVWLLDGAEIGTHDDVSVQLGELEPGSHALAVHVRDTTSMVRRDNVGRLQATAEWRLEVVPFADEDGDGMPTAYEREYGLDPADSSDGGTDADGDGATNLNEFVADTNPLNASDFPMLSLERAIESLTADAVDIEPADLDSDGDPDILAVTDTDDPKVPPLVLGWYENLGGGDYADHRAIESFLDGRLRSLWSTAMHAADLDGDGDTDVVYVADDGVRWYETQDLAGLYVVHPIDGRTAPAYGRSVLAQDLDGDGDADLLYEGEDGIVWHENDGARTFSEPRLVHGSRGDSLLATDLDGDGDPDIVSVSVLDGQLAWYENRGDGVYGQSVIGALGPFPDLDSQLRKFLPLNVADLDGDGDGDLVSASPDQGVFWYENEPGSGFAKRQLGGPTASLSVETVDIDRDSDIDVVYTGGTGVVAWYENAGDGTFADSKTLVRYGSRVFDLDAADVDGDGDQDLLAGAFFGERIAWYENRGIAGDDHGDEHATATTVLLPATVHPVNGRIDSRSDVDVFRLWVSQPGVLQAFTHGDTNTRGTLKATPSRVLDEDGDSGTGSNFLLRTAVEAGTYFIEVRQEGGAGGTYELSVSFVAGAKTAFLGPHAIEGNADRVLAVESADLDGDGDMDVAFAYDDAIAWRANDGTGGFGSPAVAIAENLPGGRLRGMQLADVDGDGDGDAVSVWENDVFWTENERQGRFGGTRTIMQAVDGDKHVFVADLDGDLDLDVLAALTEHDKIVWRESLGGGRWGSELREVSPLEYPLAVHAADFDGDGDADVLSGRSALDVVAVHENLGSGRFSPPKALDERVGGPVALHDADLNADGKLDVVVAALDVDTIWWYENLGDGFSARRAVTESADGVTATHAVDLDGDGDLDLLSASFNDDKIAWYENVGGSTFSGQRVITARADEAVDVTAADMDGDGDLDVIAAAHRDDTVAWFENPRGTGDDHGDGADTATTLSLPSRTQGVLEESDDVDVFRVWLAGRGTLSAFTQGDTDTYGALTRSGNLIARDDESAGAGNFRIEATVNGGVHEIEVRGRNPARATYELSVTFVPAGARLPDAALTRAVEASLGKLPGTGVSEIEIGRIVVLRAREEGIVSLDGLELAEDLRELDLAGNSIADVSPLAALTQLERLDLSHNAIRDLGPLLSNTGLGAGDQLFLQGNPLSEESIRDHVAELRSRGVRIYLTSASVLPAAALEGDALQFVIRLASDRWGGELDWRTESDSAIEGVDFQAQSGRLSIPPGRALGSFRVLTESDSAVEGHERMRVRVEPVAWAAPDPDGTEAVGLIVERNGPVADVPVFAAATHVVRQGFVRVDNRGPESVVHVTAIDEAGSRRETHVAIDQRATVHFNSDDLEDGNLDKGVILGVGAGTGDWRLEVRGTGIEVLTYMRTRDGFLTSLHDLVPAGAGVYHVPVFNPGSNLSQVSRLRLFNRGEADARVTVHGVDDSGGGSGRVRLDLAAGETREISAQDLESGAGLDGGLGDGEGKWRLVVESDREIGVASLLESPTGHLTNLSTLGTSRASADERTHFVPLFPSASDVDARQGFVRIFNPGTERAVRIKAFDDSGWDYAPVSLRIGAGKTVHFNSDDFELGNSEKGISGVGAGNGDWRLRITGEPDVLVMAYIRRRNDGFLTSMHDVAPFEDGLYVVPTFNPGSNLSQVSRLRLVNVSPATANVAIRGTDGAGQASGRVRLSIPADTARTLSAQELESGGAGLDGALGDGAGKWRLFVEADVELLVLSLLESPTGHLTNLSTRTGVLD